MKAEHQETETESREALLESCGGLAVGERILDEVARDVRAGGFAGKPTTVLVVFLAGVSRLLARPASVAVRGASSAGKNFAIEQALKFHPPEAYFVMTAMSEKALAYFDEDLRHRMLVIYEGAGLAGDTAAYLMRSLLSEGHLKYLVTDIESFKARAMHLEGPTGLLTSTAGAIDPELGTRVLTPNIPDSPELTREIVRAQARLAAGFEPNVDYDRYHDLQRLIALDVPRVVIPYAEQLAEEVDAKSVRIRRDFQAVLGLVAAHALLHRETRKSDDRGQLLASPVDYEVVHGLVAEMIAETAERTVPDEVRETVEAVSDLYYLPGGPNEGVTIGALARELELHRTSANRRVSRAVHLGYLTDQGGGQRGRKKLLVPGDPMPEDAGVLPSPELLA